MSGKICAATPLLSTGNTTASRREQRDVVAASQNIADDKIIVDDDYDPRLPTMKPVPGTQIRFTNIPRRKFPEGASPSDVTHYNMDHSYTLQTLLASDTYTGEPHALLGELQFAFICFLIGQTLDGFEQWKRLVRLMCSCVDALQYHGALYEQFISVLHYHITEIPEDFFVDIVSRNNFLADVLRTFFENLEVSESTDELKKRGSRFKAHLEKRFRWNFSSEQDEFASVIVMVE